MAFASRILNWLLLAAFLGAAAPVARASAFTVREVHSAGDAIDSLSKASQLLSGALPTGGETSVTAALINFVDPQSPSRGRFGDEVPLPADVAFPGNTAGDDNDFAISATSDLIIPLAGDWTFGINADNGVRLRVGDFVMSRSGFDTATLLQTFNFSSAGSYPLSLTYYEHTGQSGIELFAAPGAILDGTNSSFRLLGDTANGGLGLAPEPVGVLPLTLLAALLVGRRRTV
jgi:hypothetical protein